SRRTLRRRPSNAAPYFPPSFRGDRLVRVELRGLGRFAQRDRRRLAARHRGGDRVEIAGSDLALVTGGGVPRRLTREFGLLQLGISRHAAVAVIARQLEHRMVEAVEARQRHELELVAHRAEFALEAGDGPFVELRLPVEAWAAIVGEQLAREVGV